MTLPPLLLTQLYSIPGFDEEAFEAAHRQDPCTSIRWHPTKGQNSFFKDPVLWCPLAEYLTTRPLFTLDPAFHAGAYYVQEASSMFLAHIWTYLFKDRSGLRVLDLCAAPGGKSTLIASLLDKESLLISNDVIRSRASILDENMTRWGMNNTWVVSNDPRDLGKLEGYFDVILVDAPCSGSGLFRKDEKAINEWSEANVELCSGRQKRILADVWPALKEGGTLIYATCSYSPAEDEEILDHIGEIYSIEAVSMPLENSWGVQETYSTKQKLPCYRFLPHKTRGEGLFIAAVKKTETASSLKPFRSKPINLTKIKQQAGHYLGINNVSYLQTASDLYNAVYAEHEPDWVLLEKMLYFRRVGIPLGQPAHKDWLPAHELALSTDISGDLPSLEVGLEDALRYLKKEDMSLADFGKGWKLIKFNNLCLGWAKCLDNRMNNYLPKHWRIRMALPDMDAY